MKMNKKIIAISITGVFIIGGIIAYKFCLPSHKQLAFIQGNSEQSADYQTDVKVLHLGDEEPEDTDEFFVYNVSEEEDRKMKEEAEEWLKQDLETRKSESGISQSEYQETMDKHTDVWTQMMDESREMLVRFNGEDVVRKVEDEREESLRTEDVDPIIGVTSGTIKMWELWLNTIYEHDDEITDSERAVLLTMITPVSLKAYVEEHPEYNYVYEIWEELNAKYPFPDEAIAIRMSEI